jgi:hypothetical protein
VLAAGDAIEARSGMATRTPIDVAW